MRTQWQSFDTMWRNSHAQACSLVVDGSNETKLGDSGDVDKEDNGEELSQ